LGFWIENMLATLVWTIYFLSCLCTSWIYGKVSFPKSSITHHFFTWDTCDRQRRAFTPLFM
jgi:hypothetical protein